MHEPDSVYRERAALVAHLASLYPSTIGLTDPAEPDWAVLTIETPEGQMCWHISPDDYDLFEHIDRSLDAVWDGHTTEEKYARLQRLTMKNKLNVPLETQEQTIKRATYKPDAVVVYDDVHLAYIRDWELDTYETVLEIEGRLLNSGHLPIVGSAVPVRELHIPGRGVLSGITATISIFNVDEEIRLRVMTQEIPNARERR